MAKQINSNVTGVSKKRRKFLHTKIECWWTLQDIANQGENNFNMNLTDDQILQVKAKLEKEHDGNTGINWNVIDTAIQDMLDEAK